ncbi:unnamed protein product [Effrenium voratum]|nr:unnamed protein product [Effrenium voratum]
MARSVSACAWNALFWSFHENDIVEKEKLFYELHVQKEEMDVKTQMWRDEIERIKAATEEVRSKVSETRKGWKKRLVEIHQGNEVAAKPLTERTIEKQEQVGKLELERLGRNRMRITAVSKARNPPGRLAVPGARANKPSRLAHVAHRAARSAAKQLEQSIQDLEKRKSQLELEVETLSEECHRKREELAEHAERYAELNHFLPAGDEIMTLDVGGENFRVYRSTLQQVEGSVLATLASGRWESRSGSRDGDGRVFLDCNPASFQEILDFLRERRVNVGFRPSFSAKAARLADYLGLPVDRVMDEPYVSVEFQRTGDTKVAPGFMFDVVIPGPWLCLLQGLGFSMGKPGQVSVFVRNETCLGEAQTTPQGWQELCVRPVVVGRNRITLPRGQATMVGPMAVLGLYLAFSQGADDLLYSDRPSEPQHKVLSEQRALSEGMKLACLRGRVTGSKPFSVGAHDSDRYFVGTIEYSLE